MSPVSKSNEAYDVLIQIWDKGLMSFLEEFKIILQNNVNRVLGVLDIAMEGKEFLPVYMKVIFSIALKASASKIILAHNHPPEKLFPSSNDKAIKEKPKSAGKVLDIEFCDHLIVGAEGYYSLKNAGYFYYVLCPLSFKHIR